MAKSNYPNKLDTSIEIPAVRDNIVEVGSDVINSIRAAIFQIERTLGINPQGAVGNTVSSRLNKSLDSNGNILKEAISTSGLLSGPISDKDVSKTAAIKESKLDLTYPTTLLQDEISQISSQIGLIESAVNDLSTTLAVHINPAATNRHKGIAISIDAISNTESEEGITSLESTTSQGAFESIFSSHINYDGTSISEDNRSHLSKQIYFDNNNVSTYIGSNDTQGAIEDLVEVVVGQSDIHQNRFHSNSIEKNSIYYDPNNIEKGRALLENQAASYIASAGSSDSNISRVFLSTSPSKPSFSIEISDILSITSSDITVDYQIFKVNESSDGLSVDSVDIYGRFAENSPSGITVNIYRNKNRESNYSGLLLGVRENKSLDGTSYTNADVIQVSNPSATSVITHLCRPQEISSGNRFIKISVDKGSSISLDLYDSSLASASISQNINSVIKKLNEQFSENRLSVSAYRLDYDDLRKSEIAIVHSIGNSASSEHTIRISRGSDDCIDSIGFSNIEDKTVVADIGNSFYIQGTGYNNLKILLDQTGLTLTPGTSEVYTGNTNPLELGVKVGDIISITGSTSDDGSYVISSLSEKTLIVNKNQLPSEEWVSSASSTTRFVIYSDAVSLNGIAFKASFGSSSILSIFEVFLDKNRSLNLNEILSYESEAFLGSENLASPCNIFGNPEVYTESNPGSILFEKVSADPTDSEIEVSLDSGEKVRIKNINNDYIDVYSGKYNIKIKIFIKSSDTINSKIVSDGSFSVNLFGYSSVNSEENIILGKALYEAGNSRVSGYGRDYPRPFRDLRLGSTGSKDLGSDVKNNYLILPHLEKRSNGVIKGLEVHSVDGSGDTYSISIKSGICYVNGKRFEINEYENYITDIQAGTPTPVVDKFFVAVDEFGQIVFSPADPTTCSCSLDPSRYCILAAVENSLSVINPVDLRLFIDNIDLKILNSITVSPQPGMGHFSSVNKAVKYAKRFSELFQKAGTPTIHLKSGTHKVLISMNMLSSSYTGLSDDIQPIYNDGMWISFPLNIVGEGDSTVLDFIKIFDDLPESSDDRTTSGNPDMEAFIGIAGPGLSSSRPSGDSDTLSSGFVNLSNFKTNLTGICIYDASIEDGSGNLLNWGVNINNVIFDYSGKTDFHQANRAVMLRSVDTTNGDSAGNINITNCQFLNSLIRFNQNAADYRNINILNNLSRGKADSSSGGTSNYLVYVGGAGHIFDFNDAPSENNINFIGNIIADNSVANGSAGGPKVDFNGNHPWGERFSRDVNIGSDISAGGDASIGGDASVGGNSTLTGSLSVGSTATVTGAVTGSEYLYGSTKEVITKYYADDLGWTGNGSTSFIQWETPGLALGNSISCSKAEVYGTFSPPTSGVYMKYFEIPSDGGSGSGFKINPKPGSKIKSLKLGELRSAGGAGTLAGGVIPGSTVTVSLYRVTFGAPTTSSPLSLIGTDAIVKPVIVITSFVSEMIFDFSSFNEAVPTDHSHYLVRITHNDAANDYRLAYIELAVEIDSIEEGIGAS